MNEVVHGDCIEVMRGMDDASVDAIVTDPPYGLSFMGKGWDHAVPGVDSWSEALRVAKPGAHLLAFGGTRLFHRLACAIEDAGWEIRDTVMWVYGSGFPKSMNVSKAIDKAAGISTTDDERWVPTPHPVTGAHKTASGNSQQVGQAKPGLRCLYAPATDAARQWSGWGTALKPAWEPITVARKPLDGTVAANVLAHGTGAMNIDGCRVTTNGESITINTCDTGAKPFGNGAGHPYSKRQETAGRWPANVIHDGSDEAAAGMGEAERYFYCPKANKRDRGKGNNHPTVKPTALMQYLCRLVTPPNGIVLDPFCGSGSTGKAAVAEGFRFVGIEVHEEYVEIARQRIGRQDKETDGG